MTTETREATPNLIPVPPDWLQRQGQRSRNINRNINDIYWARSDNESDPGFIMVGPSAILGTDGRPITAQAEKWIRQGRTPLIEYSYTDRVSPQTGHRETVELSADRLDTPDWAYWFIKNGGAHLFPIAQIVELHWHITPPYGLAKSAFPQLSEWEVPEPVYCAACPAGAPPRNSESQLITHMMLTHEMTQVQARDLMGTYDIHQKTVGAQGVVIRRKTFVPELPSVQKPTFDPDAVFAPAKAPSATTKRSIGCDLCEATFENGLAKARHIKKEHPKGAVASQPPDAMDGAVEGVGVNGEA